MEKITAPADAHISVYPEDFEADDLVEKIQRMVMRGAEKFLMKFFQEIDIAVSENGLVIWPVLPDGDIADWHYVIKWENLREETHVFPTNHARRNGEPYDADELASIKKARDGFAELVAILDAELFSGKPTEETLKRL